MKKHQKRESDFSPVEGDDSWGFDSKPIPTSKWEKFWFTIIMIGFICLVLNAVNFFLERDRKDNVPFRNDVQEFNNYKLN
jgi:hypothetical protein